MKSATIQELLSWEPCYDERVIRDLAGSVESFTALDILKREDIPIKDRFWVVLRPEMIDEQTLRLFACDCAEHVVTMLAKCADAHKARAAISVGRQFAEGKASKKELAAARYAARDAAEQATWYNNAAWDNAWLAALIASGSDAMFPARSTASAAAFAVFVATGLTAWVAELQYQADSLIKSLKKP